MIFVTVGLHYQGFDRLIKAVDELAPTLGEDVIAQIGTSDYEPKHMKSFREAPIDEVDKHFKDARLIISHAGIGSIITALKYGKSLVVVPRLKKYGEHNSDHQLEVAKAVEDENKALVVYEIADLFDAIRKSREPGKLCGGKEDLITTLKEYLNGLEAAG